MERLVITERATKANLLEYVSKSKEKVKDLNKNLYDRVSYAVNMATKDLRKVTKEDLLELANEMVSVLTTPVVAPVENQVKPKLKSGGKKAKKEEPKETVEAQEVEAEEPVEEVKTEKKAKASKEKATVKKAEVETLKPISETKSIGLARMFPSEIDHKELGKLVARNDMNFDQFKEAINKGETLYLATYWSKRLVKQFGYAEQQQVEVPKAGFPFDLDILLALVACEKVERIWAMSSYTEAMFSFEKEDFELVEDKDDKGDYSVRVSAGMEFEIYAPAK